MVRSDAADSRATGADPRPSAWVMWATYAVGAIGVFLGFGSVNGDPPTLTWGVLLAVGAAGLLSFVRHSLLYRSDAARMGWDYGRRHNFQIEVGLANLAWGMVAVLAVVLHWGLAVEAAMCLTMGGYLLAVAVMQIVAPGGQRRSLGPLLGISSYAVALVVLGAMALVRMG